MKAMKKLMKLLLLCFLFTGCIIVKANETSEETNGNTYRHVMIYNNTTRPVTLEITEYRSDFKHTPPYFIYNGQRIEKYLRGINPGEHAELKWDDRFYCCKDNRFTLSLIPWMCDVSAFTPLPLRIMTERKSTNTGYISNDARRFNKEMGEIAANAIIFTHKDVYDKNSFHEDIVRKMGLNPNDGFGIFMKYAVAAGMQYINYKSPYPVYAPRVSHYYYTTCITDSQRMYYGDTFEYLKKYDLSRPYPLEGVNI